MVALSFLILYLELALIRWVSGYVHNFGYFTNFAMLAAFLGIGLGCLLAGRANATATLPFFLMVLGLIVRFGKVQIDLESKSGSSVFWTEATHAGTALPSMGVVAVVFSLIALIFLGPGQLLGELFTELPRLRAYGLNVLGGLLGILLFAVSSQLQHPPIVWFAVIVIVASPFLAATRRALWPVHVVMLGAFLWMASLGTTTQTWSPYYRQTLLTLSDGGYAFAGNGTPELSIGTFDQLGVNTEMYEVPYGPALHARRKHPDAQIHRALVIGSGGGNDVAMAIQRGVDHVDAVDINPWHLEMGKLHHPLHPYDSRKVTTYLADGREFLARGGDKYDLIVYGLPDSTFTNDRANLRVESFIFTTEAFRSALSRLTPDGIFVIYNFYRVPWLVEKLHGMMREVSGQEPYLRVFTDARTGAPLAALPAALAIGPGLDLPPALDDPTPPPATDDWPFLYLVGPTIPATYVGALAVVGLLSLVLVLGALRLTRKDPSDDGTKREPENRLVLTTLFFMGMAFVLLETRSVVTFGLFFGSTWWNNVVVFAAIHVSILLAVLVNARFPSIPQWTMAVALLASLAFAWGLPPEVLLLGGATTRALLAGTVAFLPIFCANVFFANVFKGTREGRVSYAFNLLGGMLGGLFEYVSLLVGYRALIGFAVVFYLFALLFAYRYAQQTKSAPSPAVT
jgi:SAM-dependent methyltransferase